MSCRYYFSIIISAKNTGRYLEETLESLYNQSITFQNYVQVVIVDDSSSDNTLEIARNNQRLYPDNIIVVKNQNSGVADAKNTGLQHATGLLVNFLDSDDKLSGNTLELVYDFYQKTHTIVDVISVPMYFFENQSGPHMLNKKFNATRVIDIEKEPNAIQLSSASAFFKREIFEDYKFKSGLHIGEDSLLLTEVIMQRKKYGVVHNAKYLYRKRSDGSSALQNTYQNKHYYTAFFDEFILNVIDKFNIDSVIPKYLQNVIFYNIKWPLRKEVSPACLNDYERKVFLEKVSYIISFIDDDVILSQELFSYHRKHYALSLKYNKEHHFKIPLYKKRVSENNIEIYLKDKVFTRLSDIKYSITVFKINNSILKLEGEIGSLFIPSELNISIKFNDVIIPVSKFIARETLVMGVTIKEFTGFKAEIELPKLKKLRNEIVVNIECMGITKSIKMKSIKSELTVLNSGIYLRKNQKDFKFLNFRF